MEPLPKRLRPGFDGPGPHPHAPAAAVGKGIGEQAFPSAGKPKPCTKFFSTSGCPFGESCHFLHYVPGGLASLGLAPMVSLPAASASPLQKKAVGPVGDPNVTINAYKTKLCNRFSTAEGCKFGDRCHFAHGESDLRSANSAPRGNNQRSMANGPMAPAPGFSNGGLHFSNPTSYPAPPVNASSFPRQSYGQMNQSSVLGSNPGYHNPSGYPALPGNMSKYPHQAYAEPTQNAVPANTGPVTYPAGPVSANVPVY